MGQKVNPISNRLGIIRGWDSNWYGGKNYGDTLLEDSKIRKYLNARLAKASVSRIIIERTLKLITHTYFGRFLCNRFIGENPYPNLTLTLHMTSYSDTGSLYLTTGNPFIL
ncbi:hypothetical protein AGMMS49574_30140 [Bacteroidia bacterium]|nr:hypothetical protein AGMMS49574_30140 [Bacteroidia bacterium]